MSLCPEKKKRERKDEQEEESFKLTIKTREESAVTQFLGERISKKLRAMALKDLSVIDVLEMPPVHS